MRQNLPQYNEDEYHNLTAGSLGVWKFVSRVKNSISVIPIFIPNPENFIPIPDSIRLYPDLGNTKHSQPSDRSDQMLSPENEVLFEMLNIFFKFRNLMHQNFKLTKSKYSKHSDLFTKQS